MQKCGNAFAFIHVEEQINPIYFDASHLVRENFRWLLSIPFFIRSAEKYWKFTDFVQCFFAEKRVHFYRQKKNEIFADSMTEYSLLIIFCFAFESEPAERKKKIDERNRMQATCVTVAIERSVQMVHTG